uniref:Putative splicing factor arginine/serine-rich 7 n=1 Tax=Anopheles marajoara TaxID=58244 RepID=A0A2M4BNA7_9DIPT
MMADAAEDYPEHAPDANTTSKRSSTMRDDRGHSSSSSKRSDRSGRYHDDYDYQRQHHRDHRSERDRYRDRDHRDHGSHHRDRDRKRDEDRYQRSDHRRDRRTSRSPVEDRHGKSRSSRRSNSRGDRDRSRERPLRSERTAQDRLSEEIEQELANLRRKHELAEALKKQQDPAAESSDDGFQAKAHQMMNPCGSSQRPPGKPDFLTGISTAGEEGAEYVPEIQTEEERIEFQRKMQEKLQQHLAAEGKLYPPRPPKSREPAAAAPVVVSGFVNDGSFLEMFKKLQEQPLLAAAAGTFPVAAASTVTSLTDTQTMPMVVVPPGVSHVVPSPSGVAAYTAYAGGAPGVVAPVVAPTTALGVSALSTTPVTKAIAKEPPPPPLPVFGRRRGGKILKTGLVKKVRPVEEVTADAPNDAWSLYLQEVKKYKSASCDADSKTRPLVK